MKHEITRLEAQALLEKYIKKHENLYHLRESEVIMRALARHFHEDEELWGISGLLHDLDWEEIGDDWNKHGSRTVEILHENGYEILELEQAILSHVEEMGHLQNKRTSKLDFALAAAESISGFIVAAALVRPEKFTGMSVKSITKKLKDKSFAAKVNRQFIDDIAKTGMDRAVFIQIALDAVSAIQKEIGF
ncbi:MAG: HD domain-containing protein [Patescibacteria group bacterium]|nr:HD domain-containing protein [Patescibacteria group bacterium]